MLPSTAMAWNWVAFHGNIWLTSLVMPTTSVPPAAGDCAAAGTAPARSDPAMARVRNDPQARRPGLPVVIRFLRVRPPRRAAWPTPATRAPVRGDIATDASPDR